jgi:3-oxoacyl-[acyl-carrier-protein] synthase-3
MSKIRAAITGIGGYAPEHILTNDDLAKIVDTNDEWITSRTGIKRRHILKDKDKGTAFMGEKAVLELLEKTGTKPEEIDLLLCATVTADMHFPDNANTILYNIGGVNAHGFDVSAACSGFIFTLDAAAQYIESGRYKKVVVVGSDKMSAIVDYTDRTTCVIFGDAAGAVLLEPSNDEFVITDSILKSDGSGKDFLHMKAGGALKPSTVETVAAREHYLYQEGRPVFKAAVKGMSSVVKEVCERNNLTNDDIDWLVPHQANIRIIHSVADMLDFPHEKVMINIHEYGNTTAATIPMALRDYESKLKKGDNVILTAFGGGFTWGAVYLKWAY